MVSCEKIKSFASELFSAGYSMEGNKLYDFEIEIYGRLRGKLSRIGGERDLIERITNVAKSVDPTCSNEDIKKVIDDAKDFSPIEKYVLDEDIEDVMVNNTTNVFYYKSGKGYVKATEKVNSKKDLALLVAKLNMYATTAVSNSNISDVHLPNGSRANIVDSPLGADITIRNFKNKALSIIDLINKGEFGYNIGGRLWLYAEGLRVRPANILIGGMPASGKTTLLNAMFSFFRPETRVIVIEETYELNTETQDNCVRLETSPELNTEDLVKNALRMRPDIMIIGEARGEEAKDMMTAMNIGKISMSTIHASTTRDIITRLEHTPMNIEKDIIPLIDALIVISQVTEDRKQVRRITQISEISGMETQVLLSDLYTYDYKTHRSSEMLPSVTYRDTLSRLTGYPPSEIILEERRRAKILERLNSLGMRDMKKINEFCRDYYDNAEKALKSIGLESIGTLPW